MKLKSRAASPIILAALTLGLSGCAAGHHRMGGPGQGDMAAVDMQAMCEMHKNMMSGKSPAEQQAMMQEHMKSMQPEMRQRMQAMHQRCS